MKKFLSKNKNRIIIWFILFVIFFTLLLIQYFKNKDIENSDLSSNNEIVYTNSMSNTFNEEWYYATANFGIWTGGVDYVDTSTELLTNDLCNTESLINEYNLSYAYIMQEINTFISNNISYNNSLPYFEIEFSGTISYSNLLLYINNIAYASGSCFVDIWFSDNTYIFGNYLTYDSTSQKFYINAVNSNYVNKSVSWLRFRNGTPLDITNSSEFEPFQAYFGDSITFISDYNSVINSEYQSLYNQYTSLQKTYNELLEKYNLLYSQYTNLVTNYDSLEFNYETLESNYDSLEFNYETLESNYNTLESNYNTLLEQYNALLNASDFSFTELFWAVASVPMGVLTSIFNVEVMGVNLSSIITGLLTTLLLIWLIKRLLK